MFGACRVLVAFALLGRRARCFALRVALALVVAAPLNGGAFADTLRGSVVARASACAANDKRCDDTASAVSGQRDTAEIWRGIVIAPEHRCAPYDKRRDYRYPQSVERDIVRALGAVYGPYTGRCFASARETDIEHIVATSEAHDSGLCAADAATQARFARDLRNLTLASRAVNRHQKSGKDAAEWLPARNRCWFAGRIVEVRRAYGLTIDAREVAALDRVLARCESTALEPVVCPVASTVRAARAFAPSGVDDALSLYDDNGNGAITCAEARRHGIAPVPRSHRAYRYMRDGDGDGVVCE